MRSVVVYAFIEVVGLSLDVASCAGELLQWLNTDEVNTMKAAAEVKIAAATLPDEVKTVEAAVMRTFGSWYWLWLLSIVGEIVGLIGLILVAMKYARGAHCENLERLSMQLLWVASGVELYSSLLYQPLWLAHIRHWHKLLFKTVKHSWTLAALVELCGMSVLVLSYFPCLSYAGLYCDFWGLVLLAVGSGCEVHVLNPHHHGVHSKYKKYKEGSDWLLRWKKGNRHFSVGWKASGALEVVAMIWLLSAALYHYVAVERRSVRDAFLAVCCCQCHGELEEARDYRGIELVADGRSDLLVPVSETLE